MPLDAAQQQKLQSWMNTKRIQPQCPACGAHNKWVPGDIISSMPFTPGAITVGGPNVPMVQLLCANCAYVMLFAAVPIGLVQ